MASNTVNPIQVGEVSDDLGLKVHGAIGDTIVDNLDCLADRSNQFCRKATIGDVSAVHFLHGDLHVLNEGQVNEGLSDGGQEGVARDGEGPLVHLEHKILEPSLEVWWSGVFILGEGLLGILLEIFLLSCKVFKFR